MTDAIPTFFDAARGVTRVANPFVLDDGGRAAAGFKGQTGDCVVRAIAIATGEPYGAVYQGLWALSCETRHPKGERAHSPRTGVPRRVYEPFLAALGWVWVPTMHFGSGCRVHLRADELPGGTIIVRLSRHIACVRDGVLHDMGDCSRGGKRCVYGYFRRKA